MIRTEHTHAGRAPLPRSRRDLCAAIVLGSAFVASPAIPAPVPQGVVDEPCPSGAIAVAPGDLIRATVDRAGTNASFCLKNGIHTVQVVRPMDGQRLYGEGSTVLNGSRLLMQFSRDGRLWVASGQTQHGQRHGECTRAAPACDLPEVAFIDDTPLTQVLSKDDVKAGSFYFDYADDRIYIADDPTGLKVEATVGAFAFESLASNVLIENLVIEKYASPAQKGAIHSLGAAGCTVKNSEIRLNSGAGIVVGNGASVVGCEIHHSGQTGIAGWGNDIRIENNRIWGNNIYGFDFKWEAQGVKLAVSDGVVLRGNYVYDNVGPGLRCDIGCRNVLYESNVVEGNHDAGIFHKISFNAFIRDNVVRHKGIDTTWFWSADILISASQGVQVYGNTLTVRPGSGIMLIDQGRPTDIGGKYRDNSVHENDLTFEGGPARAVCPIPRRVMRTTRSTPTATIASTPTTIALGRARRALPVGHKIFDWGGTAGSGPRAERPADVSLNARHPYRLSAATEGRLTRWR